jgi:hypothetical protein
VLQLVALSVHALDGALARVANLRLELCTRCAEEVGFVLDVGFRDQARAREHHVFD